MKLVIALLTATPGLAQIGSDQVVVRIGPWTSGASVDTSAWKTFGNGPAHTGAYLGVYGEGSTELLWSNTYSQEIQQVAVKDGIVYATPWQYFSSAWLQALDASDGSQLWKYDFNQCYSVNPPTVDGEHVYVQRGNHSGDTHLWSFHSDTGIADWVAPHAAQWERYLAPCVADGRVFVNGGYYGGMHGFDQNDGQQLFYLDLPQYDEWVPSYYGGRLYSFVAGTLMQHDPASAAIDWSLVLGWDWSGWSMNRTTAIANGRAYLINSDGLYCIDLTTGTVAWQFAGNYHGTPAVVGDRVYVMAGGMVSVHDAWDGSFGGFCIGSGNVLLQQPLVTDDAILVSSDTETIIFDRETLSIREELPFGGELTLANGRLFIAGSNVLLGDGLWAFTIPGPSEAEANLICDVEPWRFVGPDPEVNSLVTITNSGLVPTGKYTAQLRLSDDLILDKDDLVLRLLHMRSLDPGESISGTMRLKWDPNLTGKYVLLDLDSRDDVSETDEANLFPTGAIQ